MISPIAMSAALAGDALRRRSADETGRKTRALYAAASAPEMRVESAASAARISAPMKGISLRTRPYASFYVIK